MYTAQGTLDRRDAIERHAGLVRRIATQMVARLPANVELDDLVQAGMIGLLDALSRYESGHGAQFETFATQRIRGAMLDELRSADWLPRSVRRNQRSIEQSISRLEQRLGRPPADAEIAAELGLDLATYQVLLADARGGQLVYLEDLGAAQGGEADGEGWAERVLPSPDAGPLEVLRDARFRAALIDAIEGLPEREKLVMGMYYEHDLTLKEIGAVLGVTESRACQLHTQAVARLRAKLRAW